MQSSFSSFIRIWAEFAEQRDCLSINTEQYNRNWKSQSSSSSVPPSKRDQQQQQQQHSNSHCGWNGKNANITRIWSDPKFVLSFANESISDILLWSLSPPSNSYSIHCWSSFSQAQQQRSIVDFVIFTYRCLVVLCVYMYVALQIAFAKRFCIVPFTK